MLLNQFQKVQSVYFKNMKLIQINQQLDVWE